MANYDKKINLGLFFTLGVSMKIWRNTGLLNREKTIYEKLLNDNFFKNIYWFTYGTNDSKMQSLVHKNIIIISKPKILKGTIGNYLYSLLLPIIQRRHLKKCDIYKTNQIWGSWSAVICKWIYKKPLYVRTGYTASKFFKYQNERKSYLISLLVERLAYGTANVSSVSSSSDKEYIHKKYKTKNVLVIPNYVDTNLFINMDQAKVKDLIYIGRLTDQKNLFNTIKAVAQTPYQLDIFGAGHLQNQLSRYVKSNNLKVTFYDPVSHHKLPKILNQYKLYILCSYFEGMPKTLIEAMSCGMTCLGTNVEGIKNILIHNNNGWLVNTDSTNIRDSIEKLMKDTQLRNKLGKSARELVLQKFSLEKIYNAEKNIYLQLIN